MAVKRITAEVDGKQMVVTADIPDDATPEEIEQAVSGAHQSVQPPPPGAAQGKFQYPPGVQAELAHSTVAPTRWDIAKQALTGAGKYLLDPNGISHGNGLRQIIADRDDPATGVKKGDIMLGMGGDHGPLAYSTPAEEGGGMLAGIPGAVQMGLSIGAPLSRALSRLKPSASPSGQGSWLANKAMEFGARRVPFGRDLLDAYRKSAGIALPESPSPTWSPGQPTGIPGQIELPPPPIRPSTQRAPGPLPTPEPIPVRPSTQRAPGPIAPPPTEAPPVFRGSTNRAISLAPPEEAATSASAAPGTPKAWRGGNVPEDQFAEIKARMERNVAEGAQPKQPIELKPPGEKPQPPVARSLEDPRTVLEPVSENKDTVLAQRFMKMGMTPEQVEALSDAETNRHSIEAGFSKFYGKHLSRTPAEGRAYIANRMRELSKP
ncbi:MAG TPA: hypothetical protein VKQ11_00410 [Candidatus Sulfotelmatobacter sp.]|nr:hypothetical protein [Candidatus Sulfotelmatobacter sp.]